MPGRPNLFHYAVSELSQDAFICWLLAWADPDSAAFDAALHEVGLYALNALLHLHDKSSTADKRVTIRRQVKKVDIVVEVGNTLVLLIEDKVNAAEHGNDLRGYTAAISGEYRGREVLPVFLKTGDQASYKVVLEANYRLFRREDLLVVLRAGKEKGISNAVFVDFLDHLESRHRAVGAYAHSNYKKWDRDAWTGFYMQLQNAIPELHWEYVSNKTGGFMGAWWHFRDWEGWKVYLQIEQQILCLKLCEGGPKMDTRTRAEMRDRWLARLLRASQGDHLKINQPRHRGNGWSMTAGKVEDDGWLVARPDGRVDIEGVLALLREAESIVDRAIDIAD